MCFVCQFPATVTVEETVSSFTMLLFVWAQRLWRGGRVLGYLVIVKVVGEASYEQLMG